MSTDTLSDDRKMLFKGIRSCILVEMQEVENPPSTLARIVNCNFGQHQHNDLSDLLLLMGVPREKDLKYRRQFEDFKAVELGFHEVIDPIHIGLLIVEVKPEL
jgi:hypothetical protein